MSLTGKELRVRHAGGEDRFGTQSFSVDDKSGVLLVYADSSRKQALAAYNSEFWIAADFVDPEETGEEVDDDGRSEIRSEIDRVLRDS
ncbi:hypothetical protein CH302_01075 [Rhodococcus sp. 15-2388-1-1a]|uniref:hypothetical protein n=1 Tax=Nocardiaceae TaxID=85025 RepID=UPI0005614541|nr:MULTISPECIES: hypothetical protein [Rhodococcus]OZF05246.1 hypothetical protein CH302_01075 [Rhodococcus sp. 15-2388-1-1a]